MGVVIAFIVVTANEKKTPAASGSTAPGSSATTSPSSTVSHTPLPTRKPSAATTRAAKRTSGPCGYAESATALKNGTAVDVGLPPDPKPTPTKDRTAVFATNRGDITVKLTGSTAPCNVQSLVYLIGKKFYDNTACPRTVNSGIFVVQCGDPSGTTAGNPSYSVKDENLSKASYPAGSIAMANSGANTNGSQFFFITKNSTTALGKKYTVVGQVTKGLSILQTVAAGGDDGSNQAGGGRPNLDLIFKTVRISR